jgi:hypothetical protein
MLFIRNGYARRMPGEAERKPPGRHVLSALAQLPLWRKLPRRRQRRTCKWASMRLRAKSGDIIWFPFAHVYGALPHTSSCALTSLCTEFFAYLCLVYMDLLNQQEPNYVAAP